MSIETSSSPVGPDQESTIPDIRTFQQLGTSIGRVTETVNLFRGNVTFPLTLLTLANRGGLQADVVLSYESDVQLDVSTRNLESPTGIVGLGWSVPYEMISLDFRGSVSPYDDAYYLASTDGSQNRLYLTSQTDDLWTFEADGFDFSTIAYYPKRQIWEITSPDGMTRVYGADVSAGGDASALRYAIKWGGDDGNWTDSTVELVQSLFPITWNLVRVQNPWGDAIAFAYTSFADDAVQIGGAGGLRYTRASYLATMVDPSGRKVTFQYANKIYDDTIREYQVPHQNPQRGGPAAYQDRYETRYLDSIAVAQDVGGVEQPLVTIRLFYTVQNLADPATPGTPATLFKRYLTGVATVNASGKLLPGMQFEYYTGAEGSPPVHRGALKTVTYPEGGVATYTYSAPPIQGTALNLTLNSTDPDWVAGTPRYWVGPDYVVLAKYDVLGSRLVVSVFDWNGKWLQSRPIVHDLDDTLSLDTIDVAFQDDFFVLSYQLTRGGSNGTIEAWAVNRAFGRYGVWDATPLEMPLLSTFNATYSVAAGRGFILAAATGQTTIFRYVWDPRRKAWSADNLQISTSAEGEWSLAAYDNFFTLCQFQPGMALSLTIHYMNLATRRWNDDLPPMDTISTFIWQSDLPKLSFSLSDSFATATYLVAADQPSNTVDYAARIYLWDKGFNLLESPPPIVGTSVPADTKEPVFLSAATGSLVGNVGNIRRYDGARWVAGTFGSFAEGDDIAHFAYAGDLAVGTSGVKGAIAVYDPWLGQVNTVVADAGTQGPEAPTVNGRIVTVRNRIYQLEPTGDLTLLDQQLPPDALEVSNQAPLFVVYGMPNGAAFAWLMKNGVLARTATELVGRAFAPEITGAGMDLVGPLAFLTYVGPSFDEPNQITLHRVLDQRIGGQVPTFVVSGVKVDDGLGGVAQAAFEYDGPGATGTVGPYGLASQYARVKAVVGSATTASAPFGYSIYRYYDGLLPDGAAPGFLYSLANGLLRDVEARDSAGNVVARTTRTWDIVTSVLDPVTGAQKMLIGAYSRIATSTETMYDVSPMSTVQPPLPVTTSYSYNEANGQPRYTQTPNHDSVTGARQLVRDTYVYAYEQYPALAAPSVNQLTASVSKRTTVDGALKRYEATTWTQSGGSGPWAPFRQFLARSADATLTPDDWANRTEPPASAWKKLSQVVQRDARGELLEYIDANALPISVLVDTAQRFVVARVENASRAAQQIVYAGFEAYEDLAGWTLAGSAAAFTAALRGGDSFTGSRSLVMGGSSVPDSSPLWRTLATTEPVGRQYALQCWIKTEAGFLGGPGGADLLISVGQTTVSRPLPDTDGAWLNLALVVDIPASASAQTVMIVVSNTRGKAVLVDDICFSPVVSAFSATVYDPQRLLPTSVVRGTSAATRTLRGDFDEAQTRVDSLDAAVDIRAAYLSRRGNQGVFSALDPNSSLRIVPRGWGFYQSFNLGDVFKGDWSSATRTAWTTSLGSLRHTAGASDAIAFNGFPALDGAPANVFGASLRATPVGALTAPLGMSFGTNMHVAWSPLDGAWTLFSANAPLVTAPPRSLLDLSYAAYGPTLGQGVLPAAFPALFAAAGLPLAPGSTVVVVNSASWRVNDAASAAIYYLARSTADPTKIQVMTAPREWTLLVVDGTVALYADGGRVLSYDEIPAPTRAFGLFATDAVAFDNAVFFTDPGVSIDYIDGEGRVQQEQVFALPSFVATATIYDVLGRDVVGTQGARLAPTAGQWGAYRRGLAVLDWSTLTMTGLVADQNPESGGYPYSRTRYEGSPLGRKVEIGAPGAAYAITAAGNPHTSRVAYGLNDAAFGLPAGCFAATTSISADQVTQTSLVDQRGASVAVAVLASASGTTPVWDLTRLVYDAAGNLVKSTTPKGWSDTFTWDFIGQMLSSTRANEGQTLSMYDRIGRLRFQMDARGAATPSYIRYWKYDRVSRVVAEGCSLQSWPGDLAAHVDDQSFPTATPSNQYTYDFVVPAEDPPNLLARGMLTRAISANEVAAPSAPSAPPGDDFIATETLVYDVYAEVVSHALVVGVSGDANVTTYGYNNQGEVVSLQYAGPGASIISYELDLVGRVVAIGVNGNRCATYSYTHNGGVGTETMFDGAGLQIGATRTFAYAPPGWLSANSGTGLDETLVYAPTTVGGAGLYGGTPSHITTAPRAGRGQVAGAFTLDSAGRLSSADFGAGASPFTYDSNGNIEQMGSSTNTYTATTKDLLQSRRDTAGTRTFGYDASGELATRSAPTLPLENLVMTWDCFRGTALNATLGSPSAATQAVRYNYLGRRVSKVVTPTSGPAVTKLYLRGAGEDPLVERIAGGATTELIHGPRGLVQLRVDGIPYYVVTDQLGSIRAVLDASAALVGGYDYLPYGALNGPALGTAPAVLAYRFTDREIDETGLYDFRARLYDAQTGRFVSADPAHELVSPYIYANNNPLLYVDPTGEFIDLIIEFFVAIGAAIAAAAAEIAAASAEIATAALVGAGVGFATGVVQGIAAVAGSNLTGAKAAGVFFGTVALSTVGGALSGGAGAMTGALVEGVTIGSGLALVAGVAVQGGISAAQSAGQAALTGDDPGMAAWQNAIAGGLAFGVGTVVGSGTKALLAGNQLKGTVNASITGAVSGAAGGVVGATTDAVLNHDSETDTLSAVLQGIAFGVFGGIVPEVVGYKANKPIARRQQAVVAEQQRVQRVNRLEYDPGMFEL